VLWGEGLGRLIRNTFNLASIKLRPSRKGGIDRRTGEMGQGQEGVMGGLALLIIIPGGERGAGGPLLFRKNLRNAEKGRREAGKGGGRENTRV